MAIPLVGLPAPVKSPGDSFRNFVNKSDSFEDTAVIGNWTNSGGTLSVDTSTDYTLDDVTTWSLKFVTTANGQYVELPISGSFKTGLEYLAIFTIAVQEPQSNAVAGHVQIDAELGVPGVDTNGFSVLNLGGAQDVPTWSKGNYVLRVLRWWPTAPRSSGVKLRLLRTSGTGTQTIHVSLVQVRQSQTIYEMPLVLTPPYDWNGTMGLSVYAHPQRLKLGPFVASASNNGDSSGLWFTDSGDIGITTADSRGEIGLYDPTYNQPLAYSYFEGPVTGDTFNAAPPHAYLTGWMFETGDDYVGWRWWEISPTVLGVTASVPLGTDIRFWDRGTTKHFRARTSYSSREVILSSAIENPMVAEDDIVVGSLAAYTSTLAGMQNGIYWFGSGTVEFIIGSYAEAQITSEGPVSGTQTLTYNMWIGSDSFGGGSRTVTLRIRRTDRFGAILASDVYTTSTDDNPTTGHVHQWTGSVVDASPTDGIYVVTVQITAGASGVVYGDTLSLTLTGNRIGVPVRKAKGADYQVLATDVSDHHVKWLNLPLRKLAGQTIGNTSTTIAHGLAVTPSIVIITPRSNATFWEAAVADGTNVYIQASAAAQTADIYVAP